MSVNDWLDMMVHTCSHAALSSRDASGVPTYGSATSYSCRVVYKNQRVLSSDGNEVVARGMIWFAGVPDIDPNDKITMPDGSAPPIISVERYTDEVGLHHTKVFFG